MATYVRRQKSRVGSLRARIGKPPKKADAVLLSPAWKALHDKRMKDPDYALGCAWPGCESHDNLRLDHVTERRDGGAELDGANTQWLCNRHNIAKAVMAKRKRNALGA